MSAQELIDKLLEVPAISQPIILLVDGIEYDIEKITFNHTETIIHASEN